MASVGTGGGTAGGSEGRREFALVPGTPSLATPLMLGVMTGLLVFEMLAATAWAQPLGRAGLMGVGLVAALVSGTLALALQRRQIPDRVRLSPRALELVRGADVLRRVQLARLLEVTELPTAAGPVLLLSDERQTLPVAAAQLADPREYEAITRGIVDAVEQADPSGEVARRAVQAGRLREHLAQQPVRGTVILTGLVALASFLALGLRGALEGPPFPDVALGALSAPLLVRGESFRLLSYVFLHENFTHLLLAGAGMLWLGAWLEKLAGWERVVLAFVAGAVGGAVGHTMAGEALPAIGATAGVYGLFGAALALATVGRGRLPRALRPRAQFWALAALLLWITTAPLVVTMPGTGAPIFAISGPSFIPVISWPAHLGGLLLGFVVGVALLAGVDLPAPTDRRREVRGFAVLAAIALGIGVVGGVSHLRRDHPHDSEIVTRALLDLPSSWRTAEQQNELAYHMLVAKGAGTEAFAVAERLAQAAVSNSERKAPHILDTLAVAHYRQGNRDSARALLEEALQLKPDDWLRQVLERRLRDVNAGGALTPDEPN